MTTAQSFPLPAHLPKAKTIFYSSTTFSKTYLLFLPGNPGLIEYYTTFLSTLHELCPGINILGVSHAGFYASGRGTGESEKLYNLADETRFWLEIIDSLPTHAAKGSTPDDASSSSSSNPVKIMLAGHSMGCYLIMTLLSHFSTTSTSTSSLSQSSSSPPKVTPIGSLLLFPVITSIATSPAGRVLGPILKSPTLLSLLPAITSLLLLLLPRALLLFLVGIVTGQPGDLRHVTAALMHPRNVRQALFLAADEFREITVDRWGDEIWAAERISLVFFWGRRDRWVEDRVRDEMVKVRGRGGVGSVQMVVDEVGGNEVPHGFCIHHGEVMAEKCKVWVEEMIENADRLEQSQA